MERFLFGISVVGLLMMGLLAFGGGHTTDTPAQVKQTLAEGKAVLIDVRESDEWNKGHLKDAKHLPLSEIRAGVRADRLKELMPPGKIVYLHCAAGARSLKASEALKALGYVTRPLKPGYDDLLQAGFEKAK